PGGVARGEEPWPGVGRGRRVGGRLRRAAEVPLPAVLLKRLGQAPPGCRAASGRCPPAAGDGGAASPTGGRPPPRTAPRAPRPRPGGRRRRRCPGCPPPPPRRG